MRRDSRWRKLHGWWLLALWLPLSIHADTQDDYAYRHALATDGSSAAWRVELNPAIYAVSAPAHRLRDLIVVNAQGQTVPFGPLPPNLPRTQAFSLRTTLLPLPANDPGRSDAVRVQRNSDGAIVIEQPSTSTSALPARPSQWLLDAGRPVSLDRIEVDASALPDDATFHLSVQASNDLQNWTARGPGSEIVSVRRGTDTLAQRSIAVASGTSSRYYRLTMREGDHAPWDSAQTPSVKLHGSAVDAHTGDATARQWLEVRATATSPAAGGTDYDYTLPAALPLEAARITLADANTVTRYHLLDHDGDGVDEATPAGFAPMRVQHLRLHVETPLAQPPTLHVAWRPDVFVFLAEGSGPYSLLAGSYAARRGDYPLQDALERLRRSGAGTDWQPPLATLGATSIAGGPAALLVPKPPFDWTRMLLWLVLIGGSLAVAAMAWNLLQQSRREGGEH